MSFSRAGQLAREHRAHFVSRMSRSDFIPPVVTPEKHFEPASGFGSVFAE
jgi:hypothetical protein